MEEFHRKALRVLVIGILYGLAALSILKVILASIVPVLLPAISLLMSLAMLAFVFRYLWKKR